MEDNDARTVWCGNLSSEVTEDLLYELFLQAGPLEKVHIPRNPHGLSQRSFGFVTFKHAVSTRYAIDLMQGVKLFGRVIQLRYRTQNQNCLLDSAQSPVRFQQNNSPSHSRMNPVGSMQMPQSPIYQSQNFQCTELIVLDSDNSPSTPLLSPPQFMKNRDFSDDGNAVRLDWDFQNRRSSCDFILPLPQRLDAERAWSMPNSPMSNALQDPWKQFDRGQSANAETAHNNGGRQSTQHRSFSSHHYNPNNRNQYKNSRQPYDNHNQYRRF